MLAIVIPFYKLRYFDSCLHSLANQTNKNFTVYVGDDHSPTTPISLIEKYSNEIDLKYYRFDHNLGSVSLVRHWQRCFELIGRERWVMFLGDDDLLDPNCIELFYSDLKDINREKLNVVRYSTAVIDKDGKRISKVFKHPELEISTNFIFKKICGYTRSSLSEYIFKSKVVRSEKFKELPLGWHTDDLAILEFSRFKNIYSINNASVYFRNSGQNITSQSHNLIEKNRASFLFFFYLLDKKQQYFTNEQREILLHKFIKCYENDKKNIGAFLKFTKAMVRNGELQGYINFLKTNLLKSFN